MQARHVASGYDALGSNLYIYLACWWQMMERLAIIVSELRLFAILCHVPQGTCGRIGKQTSACAHKVQTQSTLGATTTLPLL